MVIIGSRNLAGQTIADEISAAGGLAASCVRSLLAWLESASRRLAEHALLGSWGHCVRGVDTKTVSSSHGCVAGLLGCSSW